jgi:hypothetical protein
VATEKSSVVAALFVVKIQKIKILKIFRKWLAKYKTSAIIKLQKKRGTVQ